MTLKELKKQRAAAAQKVEELDREIASHPESIAAFFGGRRHPLLARVTAIKKAHGVTDSRKNQCSWEGFAFTFDGAEYTARHGSNWCSSFTDVVDPAGMSERLESWEDHDWDDPDVFDGLCQNHCGVALALLLLNGIIG